MLLVIDANIIIALLIKPGKPLEAFFDNRLELFAPELLFNELEWNENSILQRTRLSRQELSEFTQIMQKRITTVAMRSYSKRITEANECCPDANDVEYFALALFLNCPIWSNDKRLKHQNIVPILSTQEVLQLLSKDN